MKKILICFLVCLGIASSAVQAKIWNYKKSGQPERVVFKPDYLARINGSLYIDRIEFFADSTVFKCTAYYYPGSNIIVDRNLVLQAGDALIQPIGLHGMEFGKPFRLLRSGRHMFTVVYPPLDSRLTAIDLRELEGSWSLYGIRLDGERYDRITPDRWLEENTFYYPGNLKKNFNPEPRPARFKGILGGYDARVLQHSFTIENYNEITGVREDLDVLVAEDGSFEIEISTRTPKYVTVGFPLDMNMSVFLEPERTATVYFDRNKILAQRAGAADIYQSAIYNGGELGMINDELQAAYRLWTQSDKQPLVSVRTLERAMVVIDAIHQEMLEKIDSYIGMCAVTPYTRRLLLANEKADMILAALETEARLSENVHRGRALPRVPQGYYDFIRDLDDELVLFSPRFREIAGKLSTSRFREVVGLDASNDENVAALWTLPENEIVRLLEKEARAVCAWLNADSTPLWWQMMTAMNLASFGRMPRENVGRQKGEKVISGLRRAGIITHPAVYNALNDYYRYK